MSTTLRTARNVALCYVAKACTRRTFRSGATSSPQSSRRRRSAEQAELDRLRKQNSRLSSELARTKLALEITGKAHALLELFSESADIEQKFKQ